MREPSQSKYADQRATASASKSVLQESQKIILQDSGFSKLVDFSKQNRLTIPERPKTSSGLACSSGIDSFVLSRKNATERESRDDLLFNPLGAHGKGSTFYDSPYPGNLPTPAGSPKPAEFIIPSSSMTQTRPLTPDSMDVLSGPIGIAVRSPAHSYSQNKSIFPLKNELGYRGSASVATPVKQKPTRWKFLAGLFSGKKNDRSTSSYYQLKPEESSRTNLGSVSRPMDSPNLLDHSKSRHTGKINSERKAGKDVDFKASKTVSSRFVNSELMLNKTSLDGCTFENDRGLLDVEIPSTKMDRYSVMFSGVLQNSQHKSALLARRQAAFGNVKPINEAIASKEELAQITRKVKSPTFDKSSTTFSLFRRESPQIKSQLPSEHNRSSYFEYATTTNLPQSSPSFSPGAIFSTSKTQQAQGASDTTIGSAEEYRLSLNFPELPQACEEDTYDLAPFPVQQNSSEPNKATLNQVSKNLGHIPASSIAKSSASISDDLLTVTTSALNISNPRHATRLNSNHPQHIRFHSPPQATGQNPTNDSPPPSPRTLGRSATIAILSGEAQPKVPARTKANIITHNLNKSLLEKGPKTPEEVEAHLRTQAEMSIARQISASQQQLKLLDPLDSGLRNLSPNSAKTIMSAATLSPDAPITAIINLSKAATSPLAAVATAAHEEHARGNAKRDLSPTKRWKFEPVVQGVQLSTPKLVLAEIEIDHKSAGVTATLEDRRGRERRTREFGGSGKVDVARAHRKSERAIVERIY